MQWTRRDIRLDALIAAPAFALALAACGGGASEVASDTTPASTQAAVEAEASTTDDTAASTAVPDDTSGDDTSSDDAADAVPAAGNSIQKLSAEEAIANAEVNQPNLASSDNVLDIETLAVADGSIQTLREVVDGDRPVLLWFFSPH